MGWATALGKFLTTALKNPQVQQTVLNSAGGKRGKTAGQLSSGAARTQLVSPQRAQQEADAGAKQPDQPGMWQKLAARTGKFLGGATTAVQQKSPFAATGTMMRSIPGGDSKVMRFGAALVESIDHVRAFGDRLHDANMHFADVSGSMALVNTEAQINALFLKMQQGENRAETARQLSEARTRLNAAAAPFEDAWANLQNRIGVPLLEAATVVLEWMLKFGHALKEAKDAVVESITDPGKTAGQAIGSAIGGTRGAVIGGMIGGRPGPHSR